MRNLTAEEKLDIALNFLAKNGAKGGSYDYYDEVQCKLKEINDYLFKHLLEQGIPEQEHLPIIYKLHRDNFLDFFYENPEGEKLGNRPKQIRITFEGLMLQNNKGYTQRLEDKNSERNRMRFNETIIMIGTGLAGLYALVQFFQWLNSVVCS